MIVSSKKNLEELFGEMAKKEHLGCGTAILILIVVLALLFGAFCLGCWIECLLWGAVMVKVFGLPMLSFWQMAGLDLLLGFLVSRPYLSNKSKD